MIDAGGLYGMIPGQAGLAAEETAFAQLAGNPDVPEYVTVLIPKLQAILGGRRDPALADDPNLDYDDAVELELLLEQL